MGYGNVACVRHVSGTGVDVVSGDRSTATLEPARNDRLLRFYSEEIGFPVKYLLLEYYTTVIDSTYLQNWVSNYEFNIVEFKKNGTAYNCDALVYGVALTRGTYHAGLATIYNVTNTDAVVDCGVAATLADYNSDRFSTTFIRKWTAIGWPA